MSLLEEEFYVKKRLAQDKLDDLRVQVILQLEPFDIGRLEPEHGSEAIQFRLPLRLMEKRELEFEFNDFSLPLKKHFKSCGGRGFHAMLVFRLPSLERDNFARFSYGAFCDNLVTKEVTDIRFRAGSSSPWESKFSFDANGYLEKCVIQHDPSEHPVLVSLLFDMILNETVIFSK